MNAARFTILCTVAACFAIAEPSVAQLHHQHVTQQLIARKSLFAAYPKSRPKFRTNYPASDSLWIRNVLNQSVWNRIHAIKWIEQDSLIIWLDRPIADTLSHHIEDVLKNAFQRAWTDSLGPKALFKNKGIKQHLAELAGNVPNVRGDGILHVLLTDIQDSFQSGGSFVAGFFDPVNAYDHPYSNFRDMVYLDLSPTIFHEDKIRVDNGLSTLAHELQHVVHTTYDPDLIESTFLNEGASEVFEIACGFQPRGEIDLRNSAHGSIWVWDKIHVLKNYERASSFFHYVAEQVGWRFLPKMIQHPGTGLQSFEDVMRALNNDGYTLFQHWIQALTCLKRAPAYGYQFNDSTRRQAGILNVSISPVGPVVLTFPSDGWGYTIREIEGYNSLFAVGMKENVTLAWMTSPFSPTYSNPVTHSSINLSSQNPYKSIVIATHKGQENNSGYASVGINGKRAWTQVNHQVGDGIVDAFLGNARYMTFKDTLEKIGLFVGGGVFMPKRIGINGAWLNERLDSPISDTARRPIAIQVERFSAGISSYALDTTVYFPAKRSSFGFEFCTIPWSDNWQIVADSHIVWMKSPVNHDNVPSLGIEKATSMPKSGRLRYSSGNAYNFGSVNHLNADLTMFAPSIQYDVFEPVTVTNSNIIMDVRLENSFVEITLNQEYSNANAMVSMPDGSIIKPEFSKGSYFIQAQVGGNYEIIVEAMQVGTKTIYFDSLTWQLPLELSVKIIQAFPNPSNGTFTINALILEEGRLAFRLFDILGRNVFSTPEIPVSVGLKTQPMALTNIASGVYFLEARLRSNKRKYLVTDHKKLTFLH